MSYEYEILVVHYFNENFFIYLDGTLQSNNFDIKNFNGAEYWYKNRLLHRSDGPALKDKYGNKEYWLDGKQYTEEVYNRLVKLLFLI